MNRITLLGNECNKNIEHTTVNNNIKIHETIVVFIIQLRHTLNVF